MKVQRVILDLLLASSIATMSYGAFAKSTIYHPYLTKDSVADSLALLPKPPAVDSISFLRDKEAYEEGQSLKNTPRWVVASEDANSSADNVGEPFAKALGINITEKNTPDTYRLLRNLRLDTKQGTHAAKLYYNRERPYVMFKSATCYPPSEKRLSKEGSYPSGHTTYGWATALILAEIMPERQNEILKRGYDFGQSRVICGYHWQSDVDAGRIIGSEVVARLHADPAFQKDLDKAKKELHNQK